MLKSRVEHASGDQVRRNDGRSFVGLLPAWASRADQALPHQVRQRAFAQAQTYLGRIIRADIAYKNADDRAPREVSVRELPPADREPYFCNRRKPGL